jgi:phosphoglycolate phosphatase-like HAD superfamily hydrolase
MTSTEKTDRLQEIMDTLTAKGFTAAFENDGILFLKVGINAPLFCEVLRKIGLEAIYQSPGKGPENNELWGTVRVPLRRVSDKEVFPEVIEEFCNSYAIAFDLDGTLVDSSESFDKTVAELVLRHTGKPLPPDELRALRAEGGFNNNWDASVELIKRRGKMLTRAQIDPEALEIYFSLAQANEKLITELETLTLLRKRHPLYVFTGRLNFEYEPIWGSRLEGHFHRVYCQDHFPDARHKPAPDALLQLKLNHQLIGGAYVGNALDDVWAAKSAGFDSIAVTTTHSAEVLKQAGALFTFASADDVRRAFLI